MRQASATSSHRPADPREPAHRPRATTCARSPRRSPPAPASIAGRAAAHRQDQRLRRRARRLRAAAAPTRSGRPLPDAQLRRGGGAARSKRVPAAILHQTRRAGRVVADAAARRRGRLKLQGPARRGARDRLPPRASPPATPSATSTTRSLFPAGSREAHGRRCSCSSTSSRRSPATCAPTATPTCSPSACAPLFQRQAGVSYLFAGSIEHLMRDLFAPTQRALQPVRRASTSCAPSTAGALVARGCASASPPTTARIAESALDRGHRAAATCTRARRC